MRSCFLLFTLCLSFILEAQQLYFYKPDNLKLLPSSETYNILQDSRGYIWFSTEAGLCRYNGTSLKVFSAANGLPENATYGICEDKKGMLWIITSRNRILNYNLEKDSIIEAPFSKAFAEEFTQSVTQVYHMRLDADSNLWLSTQSETFLVNIYTNKFKKVHPDDNASYNFRRTATSLFPVKSLLATSITSSYLKNKIVDFTITDGKVVRKLKIPFNENSSPSWRFLSALNKKGEGFIGVNNVLVKINPDLTYSVYQTDNVILQVYIDKDDGLWLGTLKTGVLYYPGSQINDNKITCLPGLTVTGIYEDGENGIWCSTIEKGIFYSRSKAVISYANNKGLDKKSDFLKVVGNKLFTSSEKNEVIEIEGHEMKRHFVENTSGTAIMDVVRYKQNLYLSATAFITRMDTLFRNPVKVTTVKYNSEVGARQLSAGGSRNELFSLQPGAVWEIENNKALMKTGVLKSAALCMLNTRGNKLLLGCKEGLYEVGLDNYKDKKVNGVGNYVTRIMESSDGKIWITTKGNGIYLLKGTSVTKISDSLGLPTQRFFDICEDAHASVWVASNVGLIKIAKPYRRENVKVFNSLDGLISNEVFSVAAIAGRLYASTAEGMCSIPLGADLNNNTPPAVYINAVKVNDKAVQWQNANGIFSYYENNIKVTCDPLTFKLNSQPVNLAYKLSGLDNRVHYVRGPELTFNNLAPGKYTLSVFAVNNNNISSRIPAGYSFEIEKPFWERLWFIVCFFSMLVVLLLFITKSIINGIRKKEREKTRINTLLAEYHMSALRAQMNPHFIFNCINSIQRYILTNKPEEAYNYLSKFSKLIRLVLNYAEENLITLAQELEIIKLYLDLEQLRFDNKFTYVIHSDADMGENHLMVPVLIMQPYIENSIWHGLMNLEKGSAGHIEITISYTGNILRIVIEDNGVGRERAALLSKKSHQSKATVINKKRAEILNIIDNNNKANVHIEDKYTPDNIPGGTRVVITIPQNNNYDE